MPRFITLITVALLAVGAAIAADAPTKKPFFLPSNPVAASYMLNRLSNQELIQAPRGEFVYVAILQRKGLERKYRMEALDGLAKLRNSDVISELVRAIVELDKKQGDNSLVLRDLSLILLRTKPDELGNKRAEFQTLANEANVFAVRHTALAVLATADRSIETIWMAAGDDPEKLSHVLFAIPLIPDPAVRSAAAVRITPLINKAPTVEVQRAAILALVSVPGNTAATFNTLAELALAGVQPNTIVAALQRLPKKEWPKETADGLAEGLLKYLADIPNDQRTTDDYLNASNFVGELASLLPLERGRAINKTIRSLGVQVVVIHTVHEQMLFDKSIIVVEAGKPVEIVLVNDDGMQHNLVIVAPGSLEEIGLASEKLGPDPDNLGRPYIPGSPNVLHGTGLLNPGERTKLSFVAPSEVGEYPYVCTYPGHWRRMNGVMAVVKDVDEYLANLKQPTSPVMTEWKVADLQADLEKVGAGNVAKGKALFSSLSCVQCHKFGNEGYAFGPELTDVFQRLKGSRADLLREMLEPSKIMAERYRNYLFETKDGEATQGMIVKEDEGTVVVHSGPSDLLLVTLKKTDIKERKLQELSLMPAGLLNLSTKEQIIDLLAYLESGAPHAHKH